MAHSTWAASRLEQRMLCPGSHVLEAGAEDNASVYAAEGTAAHHILTCSLKQGVDAMRFIGAEVRLDSAGRVVDGDKDFKWQFTVDSDMARFVQLTLDYVREVARDNPVIADTLVNYANYLGVAEDDAWGTLDVSMLLPDELVILDLKYGMGVEVSAGEDGKPNPQLAAYALGALNFFRQFAEFKRVRLVISQPRIKSQPSEYPMTVADLEAWAEKIARPAVFEARISLENYKHIVYGDNTTRNAWEAKYLRPGDKQCKFCKAKATCPGLREAVSKTVFAGTAATPDEFAQLGAAKPDGTTDANWLGACLTQVDLIEDWCSAVRAQAQGRLLGGHPVPGFKLVQGRRGARAWSNPTAAEDMMRKRFKIPIDKMYDLKLVSPTKAEKLAEAGEIGPKQWPMLQELVHQPEGKPHIAPESDPRPALTVGNVADEFTSATPVAQADDYAWVR